MAREIRTLTGPDALDAELAAGWDALSPGRGDLADLYDTQAWLRAWAAAVSADEIAQVRVPALFEDERLVALLPLSSRPWSRWESLGLGYRPRWRPVLGWPHPDEEALAELVEEAARRGAREISFVGMPGRDPVTEALERVFERLGFAVARTEGAEECLAFVDGGWAGHRARFRKFDRTAKNFANRAERLGPVTLQVFGAPGTPPVLEGFPRYVELHGRGWKGELRSATAKHRRALLEATQARGWARLYVLDVAGVAAAAIIWFRVGDVAIAYSTVYDQQLAAISAGTVAIWQSHERLFEEGAPRVVDLLPGHGSQKDQLGPDRSRLVTLTASRGRKLAGWAGPLVRRAGDLADRALRRARDAAPRRAPEPIRSRYTVIEAATGGTPGALAALPVTEDPRADMLIAVAGGFSSQTAAAATWEAGDRWFRVRSPERQVALVRVAAEGSALPLPAREVLLDPSFTGGTEGPLAAVAAAAGAALAADLPAPDGVARAPIPVRVSRFPL